MIEVAEIEFLLRNVQIFRKRFEVELEEVYIDHIIRLTNVSHLTYDQISKMLSDVVRDLYQEIYRG